MKKVILGIWLGFSLISQGAESEAKLRADLKASLEKLAEVRKEIGEVKPALSKKVAETELSLVELRRKVRLARMDVEAREADYRALKREHGVLEKDQNYVGDLLLEYAVVEKLELGDGLLEKAEVVTRGMDLLESYLGGRRYDGEAVTSAGEVVKGDFVEVGPARWFKGAGVQGAVINESGREVGTVLEGGGEDLSDLFAGKEVAVNVDVSGGKARLISEVQGDSFLKLLEKGGVWLYPIILVALISAVCAVIKMIQLMGIRRPRAGWMGEVLESLRGGREEEAVGVARGVKHPAGDLIGDAIGYSDSGAEVVEEVVYERLIGVQGQLQKWLSFIAVTAATAPLLGLLGTVSGMIRMFNVITVTGTGDVKPMAGGISEALVTTLFGLVVAIPALVLHAMLSRRSNGVVQDTEKFGLSLVNGLRNMEKK